MAFGDLDHGHDAQALTEINMIPLIDVMLVLLVVFLVTAPLLTHAVRVDLPKAESRPEISHPEDLELAIQADGALYWNGEPIEPALLADLMRRAAAAEPPPELHLRADRAIPYGRIADLLAQASRAGLGRIGFVSEPPAGTP